MFFLCTFLRGVLLSAMPKRILWAEKCSLECFFFFPSTTGHIGELFADGHMLCSLLVKKKPQAIFGEAHWIGRRLHWNLKQQRLLKSAPGIALSLHTVLCFCPQMSHCIKLQHQHQATVSSYSIPYFLTVPQLLSLNKSGISVRFLYFSWMAGALRNGPIFGMMCYLSVPLKKSCVTVLQLCCDFQMHYAVRDDPLAHQQLQSWVTLITLLTLLPNHLIGNQPQLWRPQHTGCSQWKAI